MDNRISDIIRDLIAIDPQFKAHERELRMLVSELIQAKPETHFDESFAAKLRAELLQTTVKPTPSPYTTFFMSRMFYGIVGSALTILIVVPLTYVATQKATSPDKPVVINPFSDQVKDVSTVLTPEQQISNKGINAFGKLALVPTNNTPAASTKSVATGATPAAAPTMGIAATATTQAKSSSVTYTGEHLSLSDTQGKVFKRTTGPDSGKQLFDMVQKGKFGLTDLNSFSDLRLKDVQLSQDKPFGYTVGINLDEGAISISPQWEYWNGTTSTEDVAQTQHLSDAELVTVANEFLKSHGIATTLYADPVAHADASAVVFPLKIENNIVSEEDGMPFGLVVTVDPVQKKVNGVSNLTSQTYDSSLYNLETNFDEVVAVATSSLERMGGSATLGTPQKVLMHYWLFNNSGTAKTELFIPALSFPVTYTSKGEPGAKTIVIPLVKDFLSKAATTTSHKTQQ